MPGGLVRDAILASPTWPDIAADMGLLDARGVDVARILLDAHAAVAGVDQAAAATPVPAPGPASGPAPAPAGARVPAPVAAPGTTPTAAPAPAPAPAAAPVREAVDPWAPPASTDAKRSWGPLTEGLDVPRDLDLGDRAKALEQLGVARLAHATIVGLVKDVLPETEVGLLVGSRQWPLLAARMDRIRDQGGPALLAGHLARLQADTSFKDGPASTTVGRLVDATLRSLTTPPSAPAGPASRVRVSPAAARSRSTTTPAAAAPGRQAPTEAAIPAHRQQAGPAKGARAR